MYVNVVDRVREAFKTSDVLRLDCTHVGRNDCKKIGVKLRVCFYLAFRTVHVLKKDRGIYTLKISLIACPYYSMYTF